MLRLPRIAIVFFALAISCTPGMAQAGWFTDVYLGQSITGDAKVDRFGGEEDVDYDRAATFGTRVGYWFDKSPFVGVAVDLSGVNREYGSYDFSGTLLSPMLFFRFKIKPSEEYPYGQYQPYLAFGPSAVFSQFDSSGSGGTFSAQSTDPGFDGRLGFRYHFAWNYSLFGEYRFTYMEPGYSDNFREVDTKFQTHHFLIGVGWGF